MSLLLDGLRAVGVGGNVLIAAMIALAAFYVFRGKRYAGAAAAVGGSITVYTIAVLGALALAIGLGWLEPNPGLVSEALSAVRGPVGDLVGTVVDMAIDSLVGGRA